MTDTNKTITNGTYKIDPVHSTFGFAVKHNGISLFRGQFEQVDAELKDGVLTGTVQVDSVKTAIPKLKEHLLAPDFFNVEETPTVSFTSTEIRPGEGDSVEVDGALTIRGVTKSVTAHGTYGQATSLGDNGIIGFDLETTVDRRDYGLNWQMPLPSGGDSVAWDVIIQAHLELTEI